MFEECSTDIDRPGFRGRLYASCQVHSVADQIIALHHDVGNMKAEAHVERFDTLAFQTRKGTTDLEGAPNSIHRARELRKCRVARSVEDPALKPANLLGDQGLTSY